MAHQLNSLSVSELPVYSNIEKRLLELLKLSLTSVNYHIKRLLISLIVVNKGFAEKIRENMHSATVNLNLYPVDPNKPQNQIESFKNDLRKYPKLTELKLTGLVTDEVLKALQGCTKLKKLDLSGCSAISNAGLEHLKCPRHYLN